MDKSKQGFVDEDIQDLINLINSLKGYKTTSSCSGRIVLLKVKEIGDKKCKSSWLFKSHEKAGFKDVFNALPKNEKIWFLQEPFILHVKCKDLEKANNLLKIAREVGLKHSGINSLNNFQIEIRGNERIETVLFNNDERYIKLLVEEANKKLKRTKEKIKRFYKEVFKLKK